VVFEQILTIFFATGVGVAIVLYFARSRHGAAPGLGVQSVVAQTYIPSEAVQAAVADTPVVDVSSVFESQVATEIPSATSEVAIPTEGTTVAAPAEALTPIVEPTVTMETQASAAAAETTAVEAPAVPSHRVHASGRKRSSATASGRTHTRSSQRSRKR
jgi:hypothetical protein